MKIVDGKNYLSEVKELIQEYSRRLGRELSFPNIEDELKTRCEMKRLYVRPTARGMHLGDTLVSKILTHAKKTGYQEIVLDTIIPMKAAISLYKKHGFEECEDYYYNPMDDVIYMRKTL